VESILYPMMRTTLLLRVDNDSWWTVDRRAAAVMTDDLSPASGLPVARGEIHLEVTQLLRTSDWILANAAVPRTDMFSYTRPGEPWFAWEWLWDLGFAVLHQNFGMAAVILASVVVLCLTFVLLFRLTLRVCPYRFPAALVTFFAIATSSLHWWARPHLFTWLFLVMTMWILEWKRRGERNRLWMLPLLTVLWVNVHGGFFVVLLLLGSYAA
jgi:hypothetical protein